ncbi:MAG: hypothetical protein Q8O67_14205 [Deltaproteobacteria bacterium]|nr:hypothetical protein [Deltaproteobacteria bacterium]
MDTSLIERWEREGLITAVVAERMRKDAARGGAGSSLLLLAALLNGLVLFMFTQLHGMDVGIHEILLLWLVCVLPLAYGVRARVLAAASSALFILWFVAVCFRGLDPISMLDRWTWLAPLVMLGGVTAFSLGGLHYLVPGFDNVARPARLVALQAVLLGLFAMTLRPIAKGTSWFNELRDLGASQQVLIAVLGAALVTVGSTVATQMYRHRNLKITRVEAPVLLLLAALAVVFVLAPLPADLAAIMANVVLVTLVLSVFVVGVKTRDRRLVRISGWSFTLCAALRAAEWGREEFAAPALVAIALSIVIVGVALTTLLAKRLKEATTTTTPTPPAG